MIVTELSQKCVYITKLKLTLSIMLLVVQVFDLKWVIWTQFCISDLKFPSRPALLDLAHLKITLLTKGIFFRGYLTLRIFCSIFFAWNSILIIERPIIHKFSLIGVCTQFCISDLKFPSRPALLDLAHLKITLLTKEIFFRGYLTLRIFFSIFFRLELNTDNRKTHNTWIFPNRCRWY